MNITELNRIKMIEERLAVIERLLGAESNSEDIACHDCGSKKNDHDWRPMSEAPKDGRTIIGGFRDPHTPSGQIVIESPIYWRGGYANKWFHYEGDNLNPVMIWKIINTLKGWRPL